MQRFNVVTTVLLALALAASACSRQQSDWQKARETNTIEAYEQFLKRYPNGDFTAQAQAHLKDLYTERDWQKARDADTPDAYQTFLTQHPEGKLADEARTRIENFNLAETPAATPGAEGREAPAVPPGSTSTASSPAPAGAASEGTGPAGALSGTGAAGPVAKGAAGAAASRMSGSGSGSISQPGIAAGPVSPGTGKAQAAKPRTAALEARYGVQLGAFRSGGAAAAHQRWEHLKKDYPQLFKGLSSKVIPTRTTKGTLYRLQAVGVSERHARNICKSLHARSQACVVVRLART
jgi:hypothetical protein